MEKPLEWSEAAEAIWHVDRINKIRNRIQYSVSSEERKALEQVEREAYQAYANYMRKIGRQVLSIEEEL